MPAAEAWLAEALGCLGFRFDSAAGAVHAAVKFKNRTIGPASKKPAAGDAINIQVAVRVRPLAASEGVPTVKVTMTKAPTRFPRRFPPRRRRLPSVAAQPKLVGRREPLLGGEPLLDQVIVSETVPLLGKVKSGSALVFDAGGTAIVVGLFVAVFDGLDADELGRDEVQV